MIQRECLNCEDVIKCTQEVPYPVETSENFDDRQRTNEASPAKVPGILEMVNGAAETNIIVAKR